MTPGLDGPEPDDERDHGGVSDLDLAYLSAGEQARLVAAGELSPVELVDNALARVAEINPRLNPFCFVWDDDARRDAEDAAGAVAARRALGPLHGVPIALKDTTPTAGHTTTFGSYSHEHFVPEYDGYVARALRHAGAIVIGKTTTPEFAHSLVTESPLWGVTRNPWNPDRTPGGSSGGSAVAVATGCVALAEGSDMGGSVRIPAAWSGVVGLKPGLGRIPMDVLPGLFDTISHHGPLARTVDDTRLFLRATQGPDESDILSVVEPLDLGERLGGDPGELRIALSIDLGDWAVEPGVERAVRDAAEALARAGAEIVEVDPGIGRREEASWIELWAVFMAAYFGHLVTEFGDRMDPALLGLIEQGNEISAVDYKRIEFVRTDMWTRVAPILDEFDALMCPTMATGPLPASLAESGWPDTPDDGRHHSPDMTAVFNLISPCPVISVPVGLDDDGMPVGAQLVGQRWNSDELLRVASALESAVPPIGPPPDHT